MEVGWTALCPMLESCYPGANTHYSLLHPSPASVLVLGETHGAETAHPGQAPGNHSSELLYNGRSW